ncbi:hypothetical protein [Actinoplanes sp. NPDC026623]|uniref:hypothetical protein n=1 Tax=Actinoplanes sp. NPDC026623 TaxID=3155610 RepID=UPI00340C1AFB
MRDQAAEWKGFVVQRPTPVGWPLAVRRAFGVLRVGWVFVLLGAARVGWPLAVRQAFVVQRVLRVGWGFVVRGAARAG